MNEISKLAQELASLAATSAPSASEHQATVLRTDNDGTIWVSIDDGAEETPCVGTYADSKPGDTVKVEISEGRATIVGNATSPAATSRTVEVVRGVAEDAGDMAGRALDAAGVAEQAAVDALQNAGIAADAAEEAVQDAATASEQAQAAQNSASQASDYAIGALSSLSDVEKVVGTLGWIAEHGSYFLTADNSVQAGKQYYSLIGTEYYPVQEPNESDMFSYALTSDAAIDPNKTYYVQEITYTYVPTTDTSIVSGKTYYVYDDVNDEYDAVAEPTADNLPTYFERTEHVSYSVVTSPDVVDIGTYYERTTHYYELSVDDSVQSYIASHLALTNEGLNLVSDSNKYRAILASDGLRILDPQGNVVGIHGQEIQLGKTSGVYFTASSNVLSFRTADEQIAWFGQNSDGIWEMHIQNTYAEDMVRFGDYAFIKRANGNMSLKWLGA